MGFDEAYSNEFCPEELRDIPLFDGRSFRTYDPLYDEACRLAPTQTWAEFGVGCGRSARDLSRRISLDGNLYLFDSWEGIPDPWDLGAGVIHDKGDWKFPPLVTRDGRLQVVDGWFNQSLPYEFPEQLGLVHIDCDVYSSTRDVLFGCGDYIGEGTVLVFDELIGYMNYCEHEWKALLEWLESTGYKIEWHCKEKFAVVGSVMV